MNIEQEITAWICQLANVDNPDKAENAMKELIYGNPMPDLSPPKLIALGRVQALYDVLQMFAKEHRWCEHNKNIGGIHKPCPICELKP